MDDGSQRLLDVIDDPSALDSFLGLTTEAGSVQRAELASIVVSLQQRLAESGVRRTSAGGTAGGGSLLLTPSQLQQLQQIQQFTQLQQQQQQQQQQQSTAARRQVQQPQQPAPTTTSHYVLAPFSNPNHPSNFIFTQTTSPISNSAASNHNSNFIFTPSTSNPANNGNFIFTPTTCQSITSPSGINISSGSIFSTGLPNMVGPSSMYTPSNAAQNPSPDSPFSIPTRSPHAPPTPSPSPLPLRSPASVPHPPSPSPSPYSLPMQSPQSQSYIISTPNLLKGDAFQNIMSSSQSIQTSQNGGTYILSGSNSSGIVKDAFGNTLTQSGTIQGSIVSGNTANLQNPGYILTGGQNLLKDGYAGQTSNSFLLPSTTQSSQIVVLPSQRTQTSPAASPYLAQCPPSPQYSLQHGNIVLGQGAQAQAQANLQNSLLANLGHSVLSQHLAAHGGLHYAGDAQNQAMHGLLGPPGFHPSPNIRSPLTPAASPSPRAAPSPVIRPPTPQPGLLHGGYPVMQSMPGGGHQLLQIIHHQPTSVAGAGFQQQIITTGPGMLQPSMAAVKPKQPLQILPKPPSGATAIAANAKANTVNRTNTVTQHQAMHNQHSAAGAQVMISQSGQTVIPTNQGGTLVLNQMIPGLGQGAPVLVQQNTAGGVQFILRPPTPSNNAQNAAAQQNKQQNQPMLFAGGGQPVLRFITSQGPMQLQQIQTPNGPTYIAVPSGQTLSFQQPAPQRVGNATQVMVNQMVKPAQPEQGEMKIMQQQNPPTAVGFADNEVRTMPVSQEAELLPPKKKPKKRKKKKKEEETKMDLGNIMKLSGIGDDDDMAIYESEESTNQTAVTSASSQSADVVQTNDQSQLVAQLQSPPQINQPTVSQQPSFRLSMDGIVYQDPPGALLHGLQQESIAAAHSQLAALLAQGGAQHSGQLVLSQLMQSLPPSSAHLISTGTNTVTSKLNCQPEKPPQKPVQTDVNQFLNHAAKVNLPTDKRNHVAGNVVPSPSVKCVDKKAQTFIGSKPNNMLGQDKLVDLQRGLIPPKCNSAVRTVAQQVDRTCRTKEEEVKQQNCRTAQRKPEDQQPMVVNANNLAAINSLNSMPNLSSNSNLMSHSFQGLTSSSNMPIMATLPSQNQTQPNFSGDQLMITNQGSIIASPQLIQSLQQNQTGMINMTQMQLAQIQKALGNGPFAFNTPQGTIVIGGNPETYNAAQKQGTILIGQNDISNHPKQGMVLIGSNNAQDGMSQANHKQGMVFIGQNPDAFGAASQKQEMHVLIGGSQGDQKNAQILIGHNMIDSQNKLIQSHLKNQSVLVQQLNRRSSSDSNASSISIGSPPPMIGVINQPMTIQNIVNKKAGHSIETQTISINSQSSFQQTYIESIAAAAQGKLAQPASAKAKKKPKRCEKMIASRILPSTSNPNLIQNQVVKQMPAKPVPEVSKCVKAALQERIATNKILLSPKSQTGDITHQHTIEIPSSVAPTSIYLGSPTFPARPASTTGVQYIPQMPPLTAISSTPSCQSVNGVFTTSSAGGFPSMPYVDVTKTTAAGGGALMVSTASQVQPPLPHLVPIPSQAGQMQPIFQKVQTIQLTPQNQKHLKAVQLQIKSLTDKPQRLPADHCALQRLFEEQQRILATGKVVPTIPGQHAQGLQFNPDSQAANQPPPGVRICLANLLGPNVSHQPAPTPAVRYHHPIGNQVISIPAAAQKTAPAACANASQQTADAATMADHGATKRPQAVCEKGTSPIQVQVGTQTSGSETSSPRAILPNKISPSLSPTKPNNSQQFTAVTKPNPVFPKSNFTPNVTVKPPANIAPSPAKPQAAALSNGKPPAFVANNAAAKAAPSTFAPNCVAKPAPVSSSPPRGVKRLATSPMRPTISRCDLIEQQLRTDQYEASAPDTRTAFTSKSDACKRLIRYHVYNEQVLSQRDLEKADEIFEATAKHLLDKFRQMMNKYRYLLIMESMREVDTSELMMIDRMFVAEEQHGLLERSKEAERKAKEEQEAVTTLATVKVEPESKPTPLDAAKSSAPDIKNGAMKREPDADAADPTPSGDNYDEWLEIQKELGVYCSPSANSPSDPAVTAPSKSKPAGDPKGVVRTNCEAKCASDGPRKLVGSINQKSKSSIGPRDEGGGQTLEDLGTLLMKRKRRADKNHDCYNSDDMEVELGDDDITAQVQSAIDSILNLQKSEDGFDLPASAMLNNAMMDLDPQKDSKRSKKRLKSSFSEVKKDAKIARSNKHSLGDSSDEELASDSALDEAVRSILTS